MLTMANFIRDDIVIDVKEIPSQIIRNYIKNLEKYNNENDDISYDIIYDNMEPFMKQLVINGKMSETMYYKLEKKYGGVE